ncbi:MAG TPA: CHASE3 domain-containing protein [Desulfuromonadaceae bacterium]
MNISPMEMPGQGETQTAAPYGKRTNLFTGMAFLAAMTLLVLTAWLGYRNLANVREASEWVTHTYQVIEKLQEVLTDLSDAETGQRGFLITGDQRYLEPYIAALGEIDKDLAALKELMADNPAQQERLTEIEAVVRERLAVFRANIERRKSKGFQAARAMILTGRGKKLMNQVRSRVAEAIAVEMDLLHERSALLAMKTTKVNHTLLAGAFLAVALLGAVFTILMREIARRGRVEKQLYVVLEERTWANAELRQSEQRFAAFMRNLPAAAWMKDLHGRYVYANEEAERIFAIPVSEFLGKSDGEFLPPETASQFRKNDEQVLAQEGSRRTTEILRQTNGIEHHHIVSKFPVPGAGGQAAYVAGVAFDITERVRAGAEIERLNADLATRAAELEEANRELETFNYTVAHDLRQPLNIVGSYCQVIGALCGEKLDEQCREYLRETYEGTLRMNRLIEALLNFSRMARVELRRERVDLSAMARDVAEELKQAEPGRRVELQITGGVHIHGDANLLRVVLANLIGNAWKYTAMREEAKIEFGVMEVEGQSACFVRDNGAGFDMADAGKIFTPFQRLAGVEEYRGFGIGLATVERIIRRHGGRIWAEGELEKGATFFFTLPANGGVEAHGVPTHGMVIP